MKIINGKIYNTQKCIFEEGTLCFEKYIGSDDRGVIDAKGKYIVPGYVDIHTHGRGGTDFMTDGPENILNSEQFYAKGGVTTVFPTVMTSPLEKIRSAIINIKKTSVESKINFAGVHIEGPYISSERRGCHDPEYIRDLDNTEEIKELIKLVSPLHTHITLAPEKEGGEEFIKTCVENGATVSIGHSDADYFTCQKALLWGITCFTHTFNASSPILHRNLGCAGASLMSGAYSEFICDGVHLVPDAVKMAYKLKSADKFVLVTDSLPPSELADGEYMFSDIPIIKKDGKALTKNGTLAGSCVSMHESVLNLMNYVGIDYAKAISASTATPAKAVGVFDTCGSLDEGKRADILMVCPDTLEIEAVFCSGERIV